MKATINLLAIFIISFLFTSCFSLNTHQSGKTLGKGNISAQAIGGLSGVPIIEDDPELKDLTYPSMLQLQTAIGVSENVDIGVTLGLNKLGFLTKYQIIGNQESKFALSVGSNIYKASGNGFDFMEMKAIELPVFISFHPSEFIAFYSNPMINYFAVEAEGIVSIFEKPFYQTGVYKGLSSGILFNIPIGSEKFNLVSSLDVSWLSPLESNRYIFFTTVGFGFKIKTGWFK